MFLLPSRSRIRGALERSGHAANDDDAIDRAHYTAVRGFPMDLNGTEDLGPHWNQYLIGYAVSLHVDGGIMEDAVEHLRNEFVSVGLWTEVISDSKDGLVSLIKTGVPVGIVSNADGTIERRLRSMGILQVGPGEGIEVRCLVDSGSVGVEKPDPQIFDFALDVLGVPAYDTWYVGDTPAFDVVGAQRAGMRPILMDPFGVNGDFGVDCVASLQDVAEMVEHGA